jgi:PAS domain S-box-containing protein
MLWSTFEQIMAPLNEAFVGLQASEQEFSALLKNLPVGILIHDLAGRLAFVNLAGEAILGPQAGAATDSGACPYALYVPGTDQPYPLPQLPALRALRQRAVIVDQIEAEVEGRRTLLEMHATPVMDEAGNVLYALTTFHDITQQRQAEQLRSHYERALEQQVAAQTLALKKSEARLKEAQRVAQVGSWEFDVATGKITCSEELIRILGTDQTRLEINYQELLQMLTPEDRSRLGQAVGEAVATGQPYTVEHRILRPDGSSRYVISRGERLPTPAGQPPKLVGTAADISDRKAAEIALQQSETKLQKIASASPAVIYQVVAYPDGSVQFEFVSPALEEIHEIPIAAVYDNATLIFEQIHPDDQAAYWQAVTRSMERLEPFRHEWRIITPSGRTKWLQASSRPERRPTGKIVWHGTVLDVSDRKLAETALRTSEQRFQEIAAIINQFFFVRSATSGQFLYVSPAYERIWGRSCASLYQDPRSWLETVHPEDRPQVEASLAHQFTGQNVVREYRIIRSDGQTRWIYAQIDNVKDEAGHLERFVGFASDITERKTIEIELQQAKEAAEAANRAKSSFIANISHELRSPLNAILGFARLLQTADLSQEQQENARIIERSGDHLLNIINQVLDLAKIEANRITLNPTEVDLHSLLGDIQTLFSLRAEHKGLNFVVSRPPDLPQRLQIDDIKLRQVLINLLDNAFKFTDQGQVRLTVSHRPVARAADSLELSFEVQDTGPGIAAVEQALLFEAFSQTQSGRQQQGGTGLGLAISREFVRLMGGTIHVDSDLGQGSTFRFSILVQSADTPPPLGAASRRRVVGLRPGQPRYRLLIVDDSPVNRRLLNHILSVLAVDIEEAENGVAAVTLWQHWQPHVVWMDLRMPVLDGYEATRQIRALEQALPAHLAHRTVIIAVSATGLYDPAPESLEAEFDDFLQKPFKVPAIFEALQKHLNLEYQYAEDPGADRPNPSV